MRRLLKFLHTLGAAGLMGAMAALAVVVLTPASISTPGYVPLITAMAKTAAWVIAPSMLLTIVSGLWSMAITPAFQNAGWVWAKAATGILILEGTLHVLGPLQEEAKRGATALAGGADAASAARLLTSESNTLWLLLAVSVANIALAVWRPRLSNIPD
jgi:uncharacterized membrane protein